jgi:hypothetical protein
LDSIEIFFAGWAVGIAALFAAMLRVLVSRRRFRYPFLLAFLAVNAATSCILFSFRYSPAQYAHWYVLFGSLIALLEFGGLVEAYRALVEHYAHFRLVSIGLFVIIATIAVLLVVGTSSAYIGTRVSAATQFIIVARYVNLGFVATLLLLVLTLPQSHTTPIRPIAIANATIWIVRFTFSLTSYGINAFTAGQHNMLASWIVAVGMIACGAAWAISMSNRLDYVPVVKRLPPGEVRRVIIGWRMMDRATRLATRCCRWGR